jgi:hypothetical protein
VKVAQVAVQKAVESVMAKATAKVSSRIATAPGERSHQEESRSESTQASSLLQTKAKARDALKTVRRSGRLDAALEQRGRIQPAQLMGPPQTSDQLEPELQSDCEAVAIGTAEPADGRLALGLRRKLRGALTSAMEDGCLESVLEQRACERTGAPTETYDGPSSVRGRARSALQSGLHGGELDGSLAGQGHCDRNLRSRAKAGLLAASKSEHLDSALSSKGAA